MKDIVLYLFFQKSFLFQDNMLWKIKYFINKNIFSDISKLMNMSPT